jgi:hypothetical protein
MHKYTQEAPHDPKLIAAWDYHRSLAAKMGRYARWYHLVKSGYELDRRLARVFHWCHRPRVVRGLASSQAVAVQRKKAERLRASFTTLAEQWRRETKFSSSVDDKVLHSAYQSIIAMGRPAVPLVLEELEARRGHWFWALHFMTGVDPVPEGANVDVARDAWLKWGRQEGYLE